jgi:hypothetical protein
VIEYERELSCGGNNQRQCVKALGKNCLHVYYTELEGGAKGAAHLDVIRRLDVHGCVERVVDRHLFYEGAAGRLSTQ